MTQEDFQKLVDSLAATPGEIRRLVEGLTEDAQRSRPADGEFSVLENISHLKDIEEEGYAVRIRRLMQESEPYLHDVDGARLARERDYNSQNILAALDGFTRARLYNVGAIKDIAPDELNRSGMFEGVGTVTLGRLLHMMREHDEGHIEELRALRERLSSQ